MGVFISLKCDLCGNSVQAYVASTKVVRVASGFNHLHDPECSAWEVDGSGGQEGQEPRPKEGNGKYDA